MEGQREGGKKSLKVNETQLKKGVLGASNNIAQHLLPWPVGLAPADLWGQWSGLMKLGGEWAPSQGLLRFSGPTAGAQAPVPISVLSWKVAKRVALVGSCDHVGVSGLPLLVAGSKNHTQFNCPLRSLEPDSE